jgi:hypothetical protein
VIEYFLNGTSAEEFISSQDNLFDFLYAGRAQLKHAFWKGVPLQKNNRWYKSVDGQPILSFRTLEEAASEKKGHKLSGSDSAVPVNRIEDPSVPADLDREHYIDEIVKVCNRIKERHVSKETGGGSLLDKAKKFAELGFHIVPKGTPQNPKANPPGRYDEIWPVGIEDFPWHRYNGFGAYSGPRDGIVAIDIDNVPLATASGLFDVLKPKSPRSILRRGARRDTPMMSRKGFREGAYCLSTTETA